MNAILFALIGWVGLGKYFSIPVLAPQLFCSLTRVHAGQFLLAIAIACLECSQMVFYQSFSEPLFLLLALSFLKINLNTFRCRYGIFFVFLVVLILMKSDIEKSQKAVAIFFIMSLSLYYYPVRYPRLFVCGACILIYTALLRSEMLLLIIVLVCGGRVLGRIGFFTLCVALVVTYLFLWRLFSYYSIEVTELVFFLEGANLWRIFSNIYVLECYQNNTFEALLGFQDKYCGEFYLKEFWRNSQTFINNFYISDGTPQGILFRFWFEYGALGTAFISLFLFRVSRKLEFFRDGGYSWFREFLIVILIICLFFQSWFGSPVFWSVCAIIFGTSVLVKVDGFGNEKKIISDYS